MKKLYQGPGSDVVEYLEPVFGVEEWNKLNVALYRLLKANGNSVAAEIVSKYQFQLLNGTNDWKDEFKVLHSDLVLNDYTELCESYEKSKDVKMAFLQIEKTMRELNYPIRFITANFDIESKFDAVVLSSPKITNHTVERALADAEELIHSRGPASALDRVHTAFHGYLKVVLKNSKLDFKDDASVTELFKILRKDHPVFSSLESREEDIFKIIKSMSNVVDSVNTLRNHASVAHPNENILNDAEALLAI